MHARHAQHAAHALDFEHIHCFQFSDYNQCAIATSIIARSSINMISSNPDQTLQENFCKKFLGNQLSSNVILIHLNITPTEDSSHHSATNTRSVTACLPSLSAVTDDISSQNCEPTLEYHTQK